MNLFDGVLCIGLLQFICVIAIRTVETTHKTRWANEKELWCHRCDSMADGEHCSNVSENHTQLHHKCSKEQKKCLVRRISMSTSTEEITGKPSVWLVQRNCTENCEPGCIVIGERTKLHSCITCCDEHIGSGVELQEWLIVEPKISYDRFFDEDVVLIQIHKWLLIFHDSGNLQFTSDFKAEWIKASDDGTTANGTDVAAGCGFKTGFIQGLKGRAAVSICESASLTGYFEVNVGQSYFFHPSLSHFGKHVLFKTTKKLEFPGASSSSRFVRSAPYSHSDNWLFNLTGDTIDIQNDENDEVDIHINFHDSSGSRSKNDSGKTLDRDRKIPLENLRKNFGSYTGEYDEENGYFYDTAWSAVITEVHSWSGSILPNRWLEIAVGVDYTLINFHGKDKVQQYVLSLMNIVNAIYQDASLGANIKLVIARLLFYEHGKHGIVRPGNATKSLENVNVWNRKLHATLKPDQPKHDIAIWLTRLDLGGPSGYAPVGGVCDPKRSCALTKDEGLSSAFIIAHEMAHILGLSHDGDKKSRNSCENESFEGSVMASMVSATFSKFSWSSCSKKEYNDKVGNWTCLLNSPRTSEEILLNSTLQTTFSMDEQCRVEFGDGYLMCRAFDIIEPCSHLWCGHKDYPLVCKTKKGPPLEGTECGFGKWCLSGYCTDVPQKSDMVPVVLNPQHGGWSNWTFWGPCSRTCGIGVQYRYRNCDNPKPSYGGKMCEGPSEEFQTCNKLQCKNQFEDLKAQQCKMLPNILNISGSGQQDTWLPYESPEDDKKCKFSCVSDERKEVLVLDENFLDGTRCSYNNEDQICIQGKCQVIGCDGKLNSTLSRDKCGVCGGDNSKCIHINKTIKKRVKKEIKKIAVIPKMARHIKIESNVTGSNSTKTLHVAFVLKNRKKKGYVVTIPNTTMHSKIIEGTNVFYKKSTNNHTIWASGPLLSELLIMIVTSPKQLSKGVDLHSNTQYSINKDFLVFSKRYMWIKGGWGPCSVSCGGGKRLKTVGCWDQEAGKIVKKKYCSLFDKPLVEIEFCNKFGCDFQWISGEWEPCSTTCGFQGIQHREVYCIPSAMISTNIYNVSTLLKYLVSPNKCTAQPPSTSRPCNRMPCLYNWEFSPWSECSASCGKGFAFRTAYCPATTQDGTCGDPIPTQKRVCAGNFTRLNHQHCKGRKLRDCKKDESQYCSFRLLEPYCQLKGFKRLCCQSCVSFQNNHFQDSYV
ncbi:hypothetical protein ABEB36_012156 [Hypothenemus hampei]|uniref:Uncharacterized protein n=1 Tax=Hypothenemus hampei TaxID=57062 RepID=A0ABD1EB20_HYPHA